MQSKTDHNIIYMNISILWILVIHLRESSRRCRNICELYDRLNHPFDGKCVAYDQLRKYSLFHTPLLPYWNNNPIDVIRKSSICPRSTCFYPPYIHWSIYNCESSTQLEHEIYPLCNIMIIYTLE